MQQITTLTVISLPNGWHKAFCLPLMLHSHLLIQGEGELNEKEGAFMSLNDCTQSKSRAKSEAKLYMKSFSSQEEPIQIAHSLPLINLCGDAAHSNRWHTWRRYYTRQSDFLEIDAQGSAVEEKRSPKCKG